MFGATIALDNVDLTVSKGEVVGLLGHNGAGKSTLVNVATGAYPPDRGDMRIDGEPVAMRGDPIAAERAGIKVIHQEPALAPNLTILDNICLGRDIDRSSQRERRDYAQRALEIVGSDLALDRPVATLNVGNRQIVDLARALASQLRVLFLDEPTGGLGRSETERLHALLRRLAADGQAIIYVSHRLRDILEVCGRIVVLREGKVVLDRDAAGLTGDVLAEALSPGVELAHHDTARTSRVEEVLLEVERPGRRLAFTRGEIVGLYGMAGGPQFRMLEDLFGLGDPPTAELEGRPFSPRSPIDAKRMGVYHVTGDRERDGVIPLMSAIDNLLLPWMARFQRAFTLQRTLMTATYEEAVKVLDIRGASMDSPMSAFSGGNRQKHVLGRWFFGQPPARLLLLAQPTQGVDVGARADIARALRGAADAGTTILVASAETDEIALLVDRAIVCEGPDWIDVERGPDLEQRLLDTLLTRVGEAA